MPLGNKQYFFEVNNFIKLVQVTGIIYEDHERQNKDNRETLKFLIDKSGSLGKGQEKSSKPDKPHHSDKPDWEKKPFKKKANSKSVDISSATDEKPYTDIVVALKSSPHNL
jgi:hypothetical protein